MTCGSNATVAMLRGLVPKCPVCEGSLSGHRFVQLASTVAAEGNRSRVLEFIEHFRRHRWETLVGYQDFQGDQNAVIVFLIAGQHESGIAILIRDPYELYESAELYLTEELGADEMISVSGLVPGNDLQDF